MAEDAAGLLRELDLAPAHVIGASMGGMIAQTLAARRPELVLSLTSIMSTTGSRRVGQPAVRLLPMLASRPPTGREAAIERADKVFSMIGSRGLPRDDEHIREVAARSYDRGRGDGAGQARQLAAVIASGNRTAELRRITAPTLAIHGTGDPLIRPSGGRATVRAIPGARLMTIEGMGRRSAGPLRHPLPAARGVVEDHRGDRGERGSRGGGEARSGGGLSSAEPLAGQASATSSSRASR